MLRGRALHTEAPVLKALGLVFGAAESLTWYSVSPAIQQARTKT